jgi:ParB-like chromosome segregation protein Spo0J
MEATIKIIDLTTNEVIERAMNAEELAQYEVDQAAQAVKASTQHEAAAARQEILDRLGITADEARLLLGGN